MSLSQLRLQLVDTALEKKNRLTVDQYFFLRGPISTGYPGYSFLQAGQG